MDKNQHPQYPEDEETYLPPTGPPPKGSTASELPAEPVPYDPPAPTHHVTHLHEQQQQQQQSQSQSQSQTQTQSQQQYQEPLYDDYSASSKPQPFRPHSDEPLVDPQQQSHSKLSPNRISKKWQQRLYWLIPLGILAIVLTVLFEVYKSSFEKWVQPLANWLRDRESWSWTLPVAILFVLSFPPLFGHEIVQIVVGLTYPLGVALGIACAGSILGEAGCFIVFKYFFTGYVDKKIATKVRWAAIARVAQTAGFRGVLVIRYSIVPPHLANPLFACTGMKFWLYMVTVILSLPKALVFVALGSPGSEHSKGAKWAKVVAIGIVVAITIFASIWIRKRMAIATAEIEHERGLAIGNMNPARDEEYEMVGLNEQEETEYRGAGGPTSKPYDPPTVK